MPQHIPVMKRCEPPARLATLLGDKVADGFARRRLHPRWEGSPLWFRHVSFTLGVIGSRVHVATMPRADTMTHAIS